MPERLFIGGSLDGTVREVPYYAHATYAGGRSCATFWPSSPPPEDQAEQGAYIEEVYQRVGDLMAIVGVDHDQQILDDAYRTWKGGIIELPSRSELLLPGWDWHQLDNDDRLMIADQWEDSGATVYAEHLRHKRWSLRRSGRTARLALAVVEFLETVRSCLVIGHPRHCQMEVEGVLGRRSSAYGRHRRGHSGHVTIKGSVAWFESPESHQYAVRGQNLAEFWHHGAIGPAVRHSRFRWSDHHPWIDLDVQGLPDAVLESRADHA